jgi:hypothetical protein
MAASQLVLSFDSRSNIYYLYTDIWLDIWLTFD